MSEEMKQPAEAVVAEHESRADTGRGLATASLGYATPLQLMWWKFKRHRLAMVASVVIILLYLTAIFADVLAPYDPNRRHGMPWASPQLPQIITEEGFRPVVAVYGLTGTIDPETYQRVYTPDPSRVYRIRFFVRSEQPYRFLGLFDARLKLFGVEPGGSVFLFGTDRMGRDLFSRTLHGARVSLSIGLAGVALSLLFGIILGGVSGYFGGIVDTLVQRLIEILFSFPTIPLWMALAAAVPREWGPMQEYLAITVILSVVGWTQLGRVVRGKFLSLREEDFVLAAQLGGASQARVIFRHLLPSFYSHIIAAITIAIPSMIIAETALSFLGIGMKPPAISWGVLLQDAQSVYVVAMAPWLFFPVTFVVITVLAFNFVGDGIRDAADPYSEVT